MKADITILMVTYNGLEDTKNCIESLGDTEHPFKLLVIDNNSFPQYKSWLQINRIDTVFLTSRVGVFAAMAYGMSEVKTKYVCYIHQDMTFPNPEWLTDHMKLYEDGNMLMVNQYYSGREERKRSMVCGLLLYSFIMDMETYRSCPVDWRYNLYVGDLEHQFRFVQKYGKGRWSLSETTNAEHRGGVIVRERGRETSLRIVKEDTQVFKDIYGVRIPEQTMLINIADNLFQSKQIGIQVPPLPLNLQELGK